MDKWLVNGFHRLSICPSWKNLDDERLVSFNNVESTATINTIRPQLPTIVGG